MSPRRFYGKTSNGNDGYNCLLAAVTILVTMGKRWVFENYNTMITITKPSIFEFGDKVRIQNTVDIDGKEENLWFEVPSEYAEYLCPERSDAYVIGLLNYAMRHQHDITCEVPMGEELHYQISTYLIPSLAKHSKVLYPTTIFSALDCTPISNAGGVGTGLSCGIDSFHVLANHVDCPYPSLKLTHFTHNNVGSHGIGDQAEIKRQNRETHSIKCANEIGLKIITTNSNYGDIFRQNHLLTHTYSSCFAIYMLQKLWRVYFYASSGYNFSGFIIKDSEKRPPGHYELLSLDCFSTKSLKIYSEGGAKTRLEKTKTIVDYPLAKKYLNVCLTQFTNCGKCAKCRRTLLALDALDQLDKFHSIFDIDYYKSNRYEYYCWLYKENIHGNEMIREIYDLLSPKVKFFQIKIFQWCVYSLLRNPCDRNTWDTLGQQLLPQPVYRWIKNLLQR